jgi:hypothetical protein
MPRRRGDDDDDERDGAQSGELPQRQAENAARLRPRQRAEKLRRDERAQRDGAADPEGQAEVIEQVRKQIEPVGHIRRRKSNLFDMHALLLLLTVASTLVLRTGDRIAVDGPVHEENGVVTFRSAGVLYSMPAKEVERIDTAEPAPAAKPVTAAKPTPQMPKRLRLSEEERRKRLAELEKNHSGTATSPQAIMNSYPSPPSQAEVEQARTDEWAWRRDARAHEETIRRAQEEVTLIENRIQQLQQQILSFVSLGYKASQFTYQSTELARAQEQLPYARLEVERAKRANEQFREDARRQGVLPGWLR